MARTRAHRLVPALALAAVYQSVLAVECTGDCGDAAGSQVPLDLAASIHGTDLRSLLRSIKSRLPHTAFTHFISQGNGTGGRPQLGAAHGTHGSDPLLTDLMDLDSERREGIREAGCVPRKVPVAVPRPDDPLVIYTPNCVMVPRCSGCCGHELLQCSPSKVKNIRKKVLALRLAAEGEVELAHQESSVVRVPMEKHVECSCQCRVKSSDCTARQRYDAPNCRCVCPNQHQAATCPGDKIWSFEECTCKCPEVGECSTGYRFDPIQCRCLPSSLYRSDTTRAPLRSSDDVTRRATNPAPWRGSWRQDVFSAVVTDRPPTPRPALSAPGPFQDPRDRSNTYRNPTETGVSRYTPDRTRFNQFDTSSYRYTQPDRSGSDRYSPAGDRYGARTYRRDYYSPRRPTEASGGSDNYGSWGTNRYRQPPPPPAYPSRP